MKTITLLATIVMLVAFTSCAGSAVEPGGAEPSATASASSPGGAEPSATATAVEPGGAEPSATVSASFEFKYRDAIVVAGDTLESFTDAVGEPNGVFDSPGCAFGEHDSIVYYSGIELSCYRIGGVDYILEIILKDDSVRTPENIFIGSLESDVRNAYGDSPDIDSAGLIKYVRGNVSLRFVLESGTVVEIAYYDEEPLS
ncbi:MAG: hypothetical protein LBC65_02105 [Oscillospiraceae bacterium]|jgi:hypothetical protein|nr:hypothetical protein [Oscillospiraceae bacterium]